jgi:tetratricopeptide (TPR) repeat protein
MLETIREYGMERLTASGEEQAVRDVHAVHFATLGDHAERDWMLRPASILPILEAEADNLRTALGWTVKQGDADPGLRLSLAFGTLAMQQGMLAEGREWLDQVLAVGDDKPLLRARVLHILGWIALDQGDTATAEAAGQRALELARDEPWILVMALILLGGAALDEDRSDDARQRYEEALAIVERRPDLAMWRPVVFSNLGLLASLRRDFAEARQRYDAGLAALPAEGPALTRANILANLAWVVHQMGDCSRAAMLLREALALQGRLQEVSGLAVTLEEAAQHALLVDRPEVAARLLGAVEVLRARTGIAIAPFNLDEHHALVARTREVLGETSFATASAQGADLLLDQVVAEADAVLASAAGGTD